MVVVVGAGLVGFEVGCREGAGGYVGESVECRLVGSQRLVFPKINKSLLGADIGRGWIWRDG